MVSQEFCAICRGPTQRMFVAHGYWVRSCATCGHQVAEIEPAADHVATVYDDSYFHGANAGYPDYLAEGPMLRSRGQWYGRRLARFAKPGRVLDIGAAAGFVLQGLLDSGWTGQGIEPNAQMSEFARETLRLPVETSSLETFRSSERYDLVSMIQVVAHFVDLRKAFEVCSEVTGPGALLLIETWNRRSWTARMFGKCWHEYSPPSVLRWFSPSDLENLVGQFGFRKIGGGRPPKSIQGAHAKALLDYKLRQLPLGGVVQAIARVIPDQAVIPYPAEDLFWALFRKS